jgi:hypothetical protein
MDRFYFHLFDDMVSIDEEGRELPSAEFARAAAVEDARAIACAEVIEGRLNLNHRIDVADKSGRVIAQVWFRDAVELEGR